MTISGYETGYDIVVVRNTKEAVRDDAPELALEIVTEHEVPLFERDYFKAAQCLWKLRHDT